MKFFIKEAQTRYGFISHAKKLLKELEAQGVKVKRIPKHNSGTYFSETSDGKVFPKTVVIERAPRDIPIEERKALGLSPISDLIHETPGHVQMPENEMQNLGGESLSKQNIKALKNFFAGKYSYENSILEHEIKGRQRAIKALKREGASPEQIKWYVDQDSKTLGAYFGQYFNDMPKTREASMDYQDALFGFAAAPNRRNFDILMARSSREDPQLNKYLKKIINPDKLGFL